MLYLIVTLAALARFAPHPADFSPAYAALLFGGACLKKRDSIWFPVAVLAVSDFLLTTAVYGMHFGWADTADWVGFAAVAVIGWWLRDKISVKRVVAASLAGGAAFFIISNFGVWLGGLLYPRNLAGLGASFVAALPFFGSTLVSSVLFSGVLFGAYEFCRRRTRRLGHAAASPQ